MLGHQKATEYVDQEHESMLIRTYKKFLLVLILMGFGLLSASCAQSLAEAKVARSDLERDASPQVSSGVLWELSSGNTEFAFRLYQELREEEGNLFFSPYSISSALAMTYGGARVGVVSDSVVTPRVVKVRTRYDIGQWQWECVEVPADGSAVHTVGTV